MSAISENYWLPATCLFMQRQTCLYGYAIFMQLIIYLKTEVLLSLSKQTCFICKQIPSWRCVRCTIAWHTKCAPWQEEIRIKNRQAICWRHSIDWRQDKMVSFFFPSSEQPHPSFPLEIYQSCSVTVMNTKCRQRLSNEYLMDLSVEVSNATISDALAFKYHSQIYQHF